jgi:uncharacterized protein
VRPGSTPTSDACIHWDPSSAYVDDTDLREVGGLDALVHLAGAGIGDRRWTESRKSLILSSRVESTRLLNQIALSLPQGVGFLASASAIGWYGDGGDHVLDESSVRGDGYLADVCHQWEGATEPFASRGTPVAHLRSGIVLSTRGGSLKKQLPLFRSGLGGTLGSGHQWVSPVALIDEVRAILWIIDKQLTGSINLVAPSPLTNQEFTGDLASALRRRAFLKVPASALRAALGREMANELLLVSQRVVPQRLLASGFEFRCVDAPSALRDALSSHN